MSLEILLADLSPDAATLARSVLGRIRALGTVCERQAGGEIVFGSRADPAIEVARLVLRAGALPRLVFPLEPPRESIEVTGLPAAAAAAEAVRIGARDVAAQAPQLDLFGNKR